MKNLKQLFSSHNSQTKILLTIGVVVHIVYASYLVGNFSYILSQFGLLVYLARWIGIFVGQFFVVLAISMIISIVPYYIFRSVAEKYKKYLDYLSISFLIITFIVIYSFFQIQN